jgi:hypothetical protein
MRSLHIFRNFIEHAICGAAKALYRTLETHIFGPKISARHVPIVLAKSYSIPIQRPILSLLSFPYYVTTQAIRGEAMCLCIA